MTTPEIKQFIEDFFKTGVPKNAKTSNLRTVLNAILDIISTQSSEALHTFYVDNSSNSSKENGSMSYPFKSIQKAIDTASSGNVIIISSDDYVESISLDKDLILRGNNTKIIGNVEIISTASKVFLKDLEISNTFSVKAANVVVHGSNLIINGITDFASTGGNQFYKNCLFSETRQNGANYVEIVDSKFSESYPLITNNKDATITLTRIDGLAVKDQSSKFINIRDCNFKSYNGFGFLSIPNSRTGVVFFESANFFNPETKSYAKLNRIGLTKLFVLGNIIIDKTSSAQLLNSVNVIKLLPYWYDKAPVLTNWMPIELNSGFNDNSAKVEYRKIGNKIILRGQVSYPSEAIESYVFFTLPPELRPINLLTVPVANGGGITRLIINKTGEVYSNEAFQWVSVDGIEFYID